MTTVDSTVTLPEVRTAPPVNGKELIIEITNIPAPRPDGKNLLIEIDVGPDKAVVHCQDPERVGTDKQRKVFFRASDHCWVIFTNQSVFTEANLELTKGDKVPAHVSDPTHDVGTDYKIVTKKTTNVAKMENTVQNSRRGPVIVVP